MLFIIIVLAALALDQGVKAACAAWLPTLPNRTYPLWNGVFTLTYVENRGAAFGMLQNAQVFFIIATMIVCGCLIWFVIKEYRKMHTMMKISLALILSGALGNFVDRVFLGYVRDMFYFVPINFPVFNVADSVICVGAACLILDLLFFQGKRYMAELDKKAQPPKNEDNRQEDEEDR